MRRDLKLRRGKEIAQACHAVLQLGAQDTAMIGCKVNSLEEIVGLERKCLTFGLKCAIICDSGKTELKEPTITCCAIGPVQRDKYEFLNELELY